MTVKERVAAVEMITEVPCRCGGKAAHQIGDVYHQIGPKRILLRNVPHFHCARCDVNKYDANVSVTPVLKFAYRMGLDEVDWRISDQI